MFELSDTTLLLLGLWCIPGLVGLVLSSVKNRSRIVWTLLCLAAPPCLVMILNLPPLPREKNSYGDVEI